MFLEKVLNLLTQKQADTAGLESEDEQLYQAYCQARQAGQLPQWRANELAQYTAKRRERK